MDRGPADVTSVVTWSQELLERGENTLTSSLKDKRKKKVLQLTLCLDAKLPPPHTPTHTSPHLRTHTPTPWPPQVERTNRSTTPYQSPRERPTLRSQELQWISGTRPLASSPLLPASHGNLGHSTSIRDKTTGGSRRIQAPPFSNTERKRSTPTFSLGIYLICVLS